MDNFMLKIAWGIELREKQRGKKAIKVSFFEAHSRSGKIVKIILCDYNRPIKIIRRVQRII